MSLKNIARWAGAAGLALCLAACGGSDDDSATYQVGRTNIEWTDASRTERCGDSPGSPRRLQATVWYPAKPAADAQPSPLLSPIQVSLLAQAEGIAPEILDKLPSRSHDDAPVDARQDGYPVLLMSHGAGGATPLLNTDTAEHLAAQGYVVVGIWHTWNAQATFFSDGAIAFFDPACDPSGAQPEIGLTSTFADFSAHWRYAVDLDAYLSEDAASTLRELDRRNGMSTLLRGRLRLDRVGMFGHSYGGSHAFRALRDNPRVVAAANLDGSLYTEDFALGVAKPFMTVASGDSVGSAEQRAEGIEQLMALGLTAAEADTVLGRGLSLRPAYDASKPAYYVSVPSARHLNFADLGLWDAHGVPADRSSVNVPEARAIADLQNAMLTGFFGRHLAGHQGAVALPPTSLTGVTLETRR